MSGPTATATFETSVHGVVVHTSRSASVGPTGGDREAHVDRRVDDVLVALRDLVAREGRAAARAVGRDAVALVEEALVPHLADDPPDRLDVLVRQRPVRVLGVDPDSGSLGERGPVLDIARDRVAAALRELGDAERLDLVLVGEPELLLDLDLDREPVAVPAALAGDVVAPHRLEAGIEILEHSGPDVVQAGPAVRRGRPLVEDPRLGPLAETLGLLDDVASPPARQHVRSSSATRSRFGSTGPNGMDPW